MYQQPVIPSHISALTTRLGVLSIRNGEIEEIFELPKGSLVGKSVFSAKRAIMDGLNVAVAESRFLQIDNEGKISGLFGTLAAKTKKVQVYIDYGRYKTTKDEKGIEEKIGYLMRLEVEITNFAVDADISSLFAVGFSAKLGKIQGTIKVTTIGLSGPAIDQYITTATSISEESLLRAIENIAVLKSKINTDEITINPDRLPIGI